MSLRNSLPWAFVLLFVFGIALAFVAHEGLNRRREVVLRGTVERVEAKCGCATAIRFADGSRAELGWESQDLGGVRKGQRLVKEQGDFGYSIDGVRHDWSDATAMRLLAILGLAIAGVAVGTPIAAVVAGRPRPPALPRARVRRR